MPMQEDIQSTGMCLLRCTATVLLFFILSVTLAACIITDKKQRSSTSYDSVQPATTEQRATQVHLQHPSSAQPAVAELSQQQVTASQQRPLHDALPRENATSATVSALLHQQDGVVLADESLLPSQQKNIGNDTEQPLLLSVNAPTHVSDGKAFAITLEMKTPAAQHLTPYATVQWMNHTVDVPMQAVADSETSILSMLLPVPLNTKRGMQSLTVTVAGHVYQQEIMVQPLSYPVQKLRVASKYVTPPKSVLERIARERTKVQAILKHIEPRALWTLPFYRPLPGIVTSAFGVRREFNGQRRGEHRGLDLRGAEGASIKACADGVVKLADNHYFAGNVVYIDHGLGVVTSYMHLSAFSVQQGDVVKAGDEIGKVGKTGRVTGPHLHLGLYVLGESLDPAPLFVNKPK